MMSRAQQLGALIAATLVTLYVLLRVAF